MTYIKNLLLVLILLASTDSFSYPKQPDKEMTYPHFCTREERDYDEDRYEEEIPHCRRNVSSKIKREVYRRYGIPKDEQREYTIDHLIPLFMGGSNHIQNLWPQHKSISTASVEQEIYFELRDGEIEHHQAINRILKIKIIK